MVFPAARRGRSIPSLPDANNAGTRPEGKVVRWFGTNTDISEQKRSEEELEELVEERTAELVKKNSQLADEINERKRAEERYRSLIIATAQVVWITDANGQVLEDMPSWRAYTGQGYDEIKGSGWAGALHPDDRARTIEVWARAVENHSLYETEYRMRRSDGEYRLMVARGTPIIEADGSIREWVGTCTDITEKKRAEEALRIAGIYNRSLIEASLDPLVTIGPDGKITDVNAATEAVTGYLRNSLIGTDFSDYFTEPDKARAGYRQVFREGAVRDYPLEVRHKDGHTTPVLYNASVYKDDSGNVIGVFAAARDITEMKRAEGMLKKLASQNKLILDSAGEGILGMDASGRHTFANPAAARMLGWEVEELIGRQSHAIWHHTRPDGSPYPEEECNIHDSSRHGVAHHESEEVFWKKDGTSIPVEYTSTPVWEDNKPVGVVVTFNDITARKRAEEALQASEKRYRMLFDTIDEGFCIVEMIFDEHERPVDYRFLEINPSFEKQTGLSRCAGQENARACPAARGVIGLRFTEKSR